MTIIKQMRGGKEYDAKWGERMTGAGPYAWQIGPTVRDDGEAAGAQRGEAGGSGPIYSCRRFSRGISWICLGGLRRLR